MKINSVSCDQFAGLIEKDVDFEPGLNLLIGPNEAGKSTLLDLIYHMFFQQVKLSGKTDTAFIENYFPKKVTGISGDVIDGKLKLETDEGTYVISKEWGKDNSNSSCSLRLPDGTKIKTAEEINKILEGFFEYGQGLLNEVVFPSQKRANKAVESIMKKLSGKKTDDLDVLKGELSSALNQAALETGGVSIDKLEDELTKKLNLYGERWDFVNDMPEGGAKRGVDHPWREATTTNAVAGQQAVILRRYYDMKAIAKEQSEVELAEKTVDNYKARLTAAQAGKKQAQANKDNFAKYQVAIEQSKYLEDAIKEQKAKVDELKNISISWPNYVEGLKLRQELKTSLEQARIYEHYNKVNSIKTEYDAKKKELEGLKAVMPEDIKTVREALNNKHKLEGQLAGLNLVAKIRQLGDTPINIISATTGANLPIKDGELVINEAVEINIPGIMELQLMPQGVDVDAIKKQLIDVSNLIAGIFSKYAVDSVDKLEELYANYQNISKQLEIIHINLGTSLNSMSWEQLEKDFNALPEGLMSIDEVTKKIKDICGAKDIQELIVYYSNMISEYEKKYTSLEELHKTIVLEEDKLSKNKAKLDAMEEIPEEYSKIPDVEHYIEQLNTSVDRYDRECENIAIQLKAAEISLGDRTSEEFEDRLIQAQTRFDNAKAAYVHWKNIYDKFVSLRSSAMSTHTVSIAPQFKKYLDIISGGNLDITSVDDKLNVDLASGNHAMTYDILSDGTKDTVSLAFRLAMLEHVFPKGNGFAVFDDPLTDMDPYRKAQSCKLIEEFAKNNQVIFVTCDDSYASMMNGNVLKL